MEKENKENCGSEDCPDCQTRETIKAVLDRVIQDPTSNLTNSSGVKYDKAAVDIKPDGTKFYGKEPHYWKIESPEGRVSLKVKFNGPHGVEGMWVTVAIGGEEEGFGFLDSEPVYTPIDAGDLVIYMKDDEDSSRLLGLPIAEMIKADHELAYDTVKDLGKLVRACLKGN